MPVSGWRCKSKSRSQKHRQKEETNLALIDCLSRTTTKLSDSIKMFLNVPCELSAHIHLQLPFAPLEMFQIVLTVVTLRVTGALARLELNIHQLTITTVSQHRPEFLPWFVWQREKDHVHTLSQFNDTHTQTHTQIGHWNVSPLSLHLYLDRLVYLNNCFQILLFPNHLDPKYYFTKKK